MKILVLHGPNLNLLGEREPEIYGTTTLAELDDHLRDLAKEQGHAISIFQSNAEHELIDQLHVAKKSAVDVVLINPGALTHTSIALRDAFLAINLPFIEVHFSNIFSREEFRRHSYLSDIAVGIISGFGVYSYDLAFHAAEQHINNKV